MQNRMLKPNICFLVLILYFCLLMAPFGLSTSSSAKTGGNGDVFMSSSEMNKVFLMEQELVNVITSYKEQLEKSLKNMETYVTDVEDLYIGEDCWPVEKCDDETFTTKIVGNPIYSYQVLKRLNVYWKTMEATIKEVDGKKTLADLKKVKNRYGGLPTDSDLQGAAKALNRLQEIYKLNITEFSRGNILGLQTGAELDVKDTFYLGRFAYMQNHPEVALRWLEEAVIQAASDGNKTIKESQVQQVMKQVQRRLPSSTLSSEDEDEKWKNYNYKLLKVPAKTQDISKMTNQDDKINYAALCRGIDILPAEQRSKLFCHYSIRSDPYFILAPIKVEVHYPAPHEIVTFHDVISAAEAGAIVEQARPFMGSASIGSDKLVSEMRVSKNTWLADGSSKLVDKISQRINWITGLQTTWKYDEFGEGRKEEYEYLQIANYGIGGHYDTHQDPMFVYKEPDHVAQSIDTTTEPSYPTGDRMTTFMIYLSEVPRGGWTAFPRLGVAVPPIRGSAVFWHNIKRSGRSDMAMLHGGCPVLLGSKWVANKWVREVANIFRRKCIGNIDM